MINISYSSQAIKDLIRLRAFIANKNPQAAQRIANDIKKSISQLKEFPYAGIEVAQAPDPTIMRDLNIHHYIIRYIIRGQSIIILKLWHHKEHRY